MKNVRIIGDIHGKFNSYKQIAEQAEHSIQIGDFGVGFAGDMWHETVNEFHESGNHRFIRGNHDNPSKCKNEMVGYISDATVEDDVMFIGGAWSIDHQWRTEGLDWWADEELSQKEFQLVIDTYEKVKPRVVITHDFPESIAYEMFLKHNLGLGGSSEQHKTITGTALETMFEIHQPEFWFVGHWHITKDITVNGTKFQCLGELEYLDIKL